MGAMGADAARYFRARDGRVLAILVPADPEGRSATAGQLTESAWPLQVFMLKGSPGTVVKPHYHPLEQAPVSRARHQIFCCLKGTARVGVLGLDGEHVDDVTLRAGDLLLLAEAHAVEYLEPDTRLIEIKQGPFPGDDAADRVVIDVPW
jgi:hypothetical protein